MTVSRYSILPLLSLSASIANAADTSDSPERPANELVKAIPAYAAATGDELVIAKGAMEFKRMGKYTLRLSGAIILSAFLALPAAAENFRSDSKRFADSKMDIVITEIERGARTSVLDIKVNTIGSSVGSSFFIVCSLRDLARLRGNCRHIVKIEDRPRRGQMLVGFLNSADEPPEQLDGRFAGQKAIDLAQFAPVCDNLK